MEPLPHSITHATNFNPIGNEEPIKKPGPLAKIRRRLTVTGASKDIDGGVSTLSSTEQNGLPSEYHSQVSCAVNEYSGLSKKGHAPYNPRKKNQDAIVMYVDEPTNTVILCVLDGHGEHGDSVAIAFQNRLAQEMISHEAWKTDVKRASAYAIDKIESEIIRNFRVDTEFSGTTLSMAIVRGNKITGVNIGDSRVILGKEENGRIVAEEITHDHKPDSPGEKERILAAGGRVFAVEYDDGIDGPPRVWLGHMDVPGLAMSRSLGDSVAHTAGVSSTPEFTERDLNPEKDKFIVIATDGLWEFVDNQECVNMTLGQIHPSTCVQLLVKEANERWMREEQVIDDTTVIFASLFGYMK